MHTIVLQILFFQTLKHFLFTFYAKQFLKMGRKHQHLGKTKLLKSPKGVDFLKGFL